MNTLGTELNNRTCSLGVADRSRQAGAGRGTEATVCIVLSAKEMSSIKVRGWKSDRAAKFMQPAGMAAVSLALLRPAFDAGIGLQAAENADSEEHCSALNAVCTGYCLASISR